MLLLMLLWLGRGWGVTVRELGEFWPRCADDRERFSAYPTIQQRQ